jgi:hypothetical protein
LIELEAHHQRSIVVHDRHAIRVEAAQVGLVAQDGAGRHAQGRTIAIAEIDKFDPQGKFEKARDRGRQVLPGLRPRGRPGPQRFCKFDLPRL